MPEDTSYIDIAARQLSEEFPQCLLLTRDHTLRTVDRQSGEVIGTVVLRVAVLQDLSQNIQHAAILTTAVGPECTAYPHAVSDEIANSRASVEIQMGEAWGESFLNDNRELVFSKAVYLYANTIEVDLQQIGAVFSAAGMKLFIRDRTYWDKRMANRRPDVFICHDSRDRESFVRPLAQALSKRMVKVWYDEFSIALGESVLEKIEEGLRECRFGIVILSSHFLEGKPWSRREFRSLSARETESNMKVILPLWVNVTREDVAAYSQDLADKKALNATDGIERIADAIKNEIRRGT